MLGLLIGAAILGGIIALMEEGEFPGWGNMVICVLAASVPMFILSFLLPGAWGLLGIVVGAIGAAIAISATCGMTLGRAGIAAGIWLVCQIGLSFGLQYLTG